MVNEEWGDLEAQFVTQMRETKIEPVPDQIIAKAQQSFDGLDDPKNPGNKLHAMQIEFATVERAQSFAKHMRNAGPHTNPPSSVTVLVDPDRKRVPQIGPDGQEVKDENGKVVKVPGPAVNPRLVAWKAGVRRGRKS